MKIYDLIIIGGGPAAMSAGIYANQMKLDTLLIEKQDFGGQITTTNSVSNYPGFEYISGKDLADRMHKHLVSTGIEIANEEVVSTKLIDDSKIVKTHTNTYQSQNVIIAIGTSVRSLGLNNEKDFLNKGLSYSSIRDREKFIDKNVAVVGGGNSAIEDAIYLSEVCKKVYLIHRRNEFRGDNSLVEQLKTTHNIELILESKPNKILGLDSVEGFEVLHIPSNNTKVLDVSGVFVAIGRSADTDIIDENIIRDENGYIITDCNMRTNIDGVYAVGDIRQTPLRQIVTAVADGAIAVADIKKIKR